MLFSKKKDIQISLEGYKDVGRLADQQKGMTCGFEAIENIIQLFQNVSNDLTDKELIPFARQLGYIENMGQLIITGYIPILEHYGICAHWYPFDHEKVIIPALQNNRGVLVIGDAHELDKILYPEESSWHAFIISNFYVDELEKYVLGYIGIDSNISYTETSWTYDKVETAVRKINSKSDIAYPVLITDNAGNWPNKAQYYKMLGNGDIVPIQ